MRIVEVTTIYGTAYIGENIGSFNGFIGLKNVFNVLPIQSIDNSENAIYLPMLVPHVLTSASNNAVSIKEDLILSVTNTDKIHTDIYMSELSKYKEYYKNV